jgi:acyl CoA:acetate/3-ketoacid CoA transferase
MEFKPIISPDLKHMDARIFNEGPMDLKADIAAKKQNNLPLRLRKDS